MSSRPPHIDVRESALFLDLDGTVLDIAARPELVVMSNAVRHALEVIETVGGFALALVSGRSLADLDHIVSPLRLPAAASHGAELRPDPDGPVLRTSWKPDPAVVADIEALTQAHQELIVESKTASIAIHFRAKPDLEPIVRRHLEAARDSADQNLELMTGKMVLELRRADCHKGAAIRHLMTAPRFEGRRPVFVGDDVTDEDGFAAVNALGGISIKVGDMASTTASYQLEHVSAVHDWLASLAFTETRATL